MMNVKTGIFSKLYHKMMAWAGHQRAPQYLAAVSFAESSVFPIPPDIMLLPMALSKPHNAYRYALICTVFSILGGLLGYAIGFFAYETIGVAIINTFDFHQGFITVKQWFAQYGFYAVLLAGITPIPYKLFTLTAGVVAMNLPLFLLASIAGRAGRFFLVAIIMKTFGVKVEPFFVKYLDRIGWGMLGIVVLVGLIYQITL